MSLVRAIGGAARRALFRALGGAAARLEPRSDAGHMARQFERGEVVWRAFVDAGAALRRAGRFDEADAMVARGLAMYPGDRSLLYEHALSAHSAGHYAVAIARWEAALAAAPDLPMCHAGVAANLRETGAVERAAAVITAALTLFPDDLTVITEAARVADRALRYERALPLWRRASAAAQPAPEWLQGEIHALLRLGRFAEAEAALTAARARFPEHAGLMAVEGLIAAEKGEWARALRLWSAYRRLFPEDPIGRQGYERAREHAADRVAPPPPVPDHAKIAALLERFASLGEGDEFELVQQRHGVRPARSLRWAQTGPGGLLAAATADFAGLGDVAHTAATVAADGRVLLTDRRWDLSWQTADGDGSRHDRDTDALEALAAVGDAVRRELAAGDRIFVYRSAGLDADLLDALHRALGRHRPARLLSVQPAAPTAPTEFAGAAGDLVEVAPGRYVGFVERLGAPDEGGVSDAAVNDWITVCGKAAALADRR